MPRRAPKRFCDFEFDRLHFHFAGLHLGQVQQVVHQFVKVFRGLFDEADLLLLFRVQWPSDSSVSRPASARIEFSGERNS